MDRIIMKFQIKFLNIQVQMFCLHWEKKSRDVSNSIYIWQTLNQEMLNKCTLVLIG